MLENDQIRWFFERHGQFLSQDDGPHVLRAIAYSRIVGCRLMLQEKDLYRIGGKLDTTACRLCNRGSDRKTSGHCDCCSSLDCSIDLDCASSLEDQEHCQCCLAHRIPLTNDPSYDAYIKQVQHFRDVTNSWLDDQPELMEIRQLTRGCKIEFFNKMYKYEMPIADIAAVIRISNSESSRVLLQKLARRHDISPLVKSDPSEELSWRVKDNNVLILLQMHISHLRTFITKKSSRSPDEDDRFDFSNHLKKQKYVPTL